jgi:hypothetical protein
MQEQVSKLQKQLEELQTKLESIERGQNIVFMGNLDDTLVERVMNADLSGTSATNILLRSITADTVLNYPQQIMIYKWKGQRLAVPVYDATRLIYP